ncbi:hypothetical protein ACJX0J_014394 [Zea mays]
MKLRANISQQQALEVNIWLAHHSPGPCTNYKGLGQPCVVLSLIMKCFVSEGAARFFGTPCIKYQRVKIHIFCANFERDGVNADRGVDKQKDQSCASFMQRIVLLSGRWINDLRILFIGFLRPYCQDGFKNYFCYHAK